MFVSRRGVLARETLRFTDNQHVLRIVRRILAPMGRRLNESTPMVDARLPDGGRLNVVIEPLAVDGRWYRSAVPPGSAQARRPADAGHLRRKITTGCSARR